MVTARKSSVVPKDGLMYQRRQNLFKRFAIRTLTKKRYDVNIKEWQGMDIASSISAVESGTS